MSKTVLGIDPGKAEVGWGVIKDMEVVDYGVIKTSSDLSTPERLRIVFNEMNSLIRRFEPDTMSVERLFFFKNKKTAMGVAEARGVILLSGARKNLEISSFTPMEIKMAVTGYGRASKQQVQKMIKKILKTKDLPQNDAADALGAALCHIYTERSKLKN